MRLFLLSLVLFLSGCSSVTIATDSRDKLTSEPTYEERKKFYWWGLKNEHSVDVHSVCSGTEPLQMQSQQTFSDGFLSVITLGIYYPRTAKVWCD